MSILHEEYLTDIDDDSEDDNKDDNKEYKNLYNFISTKAQSNANLRQFIDDIGWDEQSDIEFLDTGIINNIYSLLDKQKDKNEMKNYLREIRKITNNHNFNFT